MPVIEADDLGRSYVSTTGILRRRRKTVEAVRGVSFEVGEGELFGLLGPNGAGKTTTIKMLITLLLPTSGHARVLGHDVVAEPREVRRNVGYVFGGDRGLYDRLNARDNLRYFAELYGVPPASSSAPHRRAARARRPQGRENERVEGFSRGMRQRLHIARGLLHDPEVLFLDEPTIGIDPVGARELRATHRRPQASRARQCCSPPTTCSRPTSCATGSRSSASARSSPRARPPSSSTPGQRRPRRRGRGVRRRRGRPSPASAALAGVRSAVGRGARSRPAAAGAGRAGRRGHPGRAGLPRRHHASAGSSPASPPSRTPTSSWSDQRERAD